MRRLADEADVIVENFRPGVMERQNLFEAFATTLGMRHLIRDARFETHRLRIENRQALYAILDDAVAKWQTPALHEALSGAGVPCAPVNDMQKVFAHPQVAHRGMQLRVPAVDGAPVPTIGPAVKYSEFDITSGWAARPPENAHATAIVADWLSHEAPMVGCG